MTDKERERIAVFRYGIIAPLVNDSFTETSKKGFYKNASAKVTKDWDGKPYKVSSCTLERWFIRYRKDGLEGLFPCKRSDNGSSRKLNDNTIQRIEAIKSDFPNIPSTVIYARLIQEGIIYKKDISLSSINRYVKELDIRNNYKVKKEMRRYEKEHINDLWCGDSSVGPYIKINGKKEKIYMIALIDDASRMIVGIKVFLNDNFVNLMSVMKSAISKYGKPKYFNFDNGSPYKNEQMSLLAARIGTVIRYCEPYSPQSKSKIERWFRTCKDHWMRAINWDNFTSIEELEISLHKYVNEYNNTVHSSLGITPSERFFEESDYIKRLSDKQVKESFYLEIDRKVSSDNIVIIEKKQYEVPYRFNKQNIKLRYSYDLKEVYIVNKSGELELIELVNKIENSKIKRKKIKYSEA